MATSVAGSRCWPQGLREHVSTVPRRSNQRCCQCGNKEEPIGHTSCVQLNHGTTTTPMQRWWGRKNKYNTAPVQVSYNTNMAPIQHQVDTKTTPVRCKHSPRTPRHHFIANSLQFKHEQHKHGVGAILNLVKRYRSQAAPSTEDSQPNTSAMRAKIQNECATIRAKCQLVLGPYR